MQEAPNRVHARLVYVQPNAEQLVAIEKVRVSLTVALDTIYKDCPDNHHRQLAVDAIEVAGMLANKSIAHAPDTATSESIDTVRVQRGADGAPYIR
jgi:hypothetical protein